MRYLPFLLLLLMVVACVKEPIGSYDEAGVIEIGSDTAAVLFNVPDTDSLPGWSPWGDGEATKTVTLTFKEKGGLDVSITMVSWVFYNVDGDQVSSDYIDFLPPLEVLARSQETYDLSVTVDEAIANNLDDHDGSQNDWSGTGTIKFLVSGFDRHWGNAINDIPSYTPMRVAK